MGLRDAPLLSPTEMTSLPFPVALRTQWGHLVSRPLLVWASVRSFTVVTEGPSDEPTVHTRAIQHFLASRGQDLEWDSCPVSRHIESLCRHRRMALRTQMPLTSKSRQFTVKKTRVEWVFMCGRRWCAVDASLMLSLAFPFSLRRGVRLQCCLRTPCMHPLPWVRVDRPRVASGSSQTLHSLAHHTRTAGALSHSQATVPSSSVAASGSAPRQQPPFGSPPFGSHPSRSRLPRTSRQRHLLRAA